MAAVVVPPDIIYTILLNLPFKSIQRFKSVSKTWNTIISNLKFAEAHRRKWKNIYMFLCVRNYRHQLFMFNFEKGSFQFKALLPPQKPSGKILWIGDGLVLLIRKPYNGKLFVLWNPSSREQTTFVSPYHEFVHFETNFGLYHDPVNFDDYKIVMKYKKYYGVFSCKNKTWTEKQVFQHKGKLYPNAGLLVDGFSFWVLQYHDDQNLKDIVYFDPRQDEFKTLKKPKPLEGAAIFFLTILNGRLCSYDNTRTEDSTRLRVWILTGHVDSCCWSELMNIQIVPQVDSLDIVWPMFFTEKNEIMINIRKSEHNIVCDHSLKATPIISSGNRIDRDFPVVPIVNSPVEFVRGRSNQSTMAAAVVPLDIIYTILLNLPFKAIERFKSVSKTWNNIISNRQFAEAHRRKSKNLFLCVRNYRHQLFMFKFEKEILQFKALLPPQKPYGKILWVGDGLVLLIRKPYNGKSFVLWNPSSREQTMFVSPYHEFVHFETNFGLHHDPVNFDDYKIVMKYKTYYVVFSHKNKTWTEKQVFQHKGKLYPNAGLLVDGFSFWVLRDDDDDQNSKDIVYFDPRQDKFKTLKKPKPLEGATTFFLTILDGCLCSYDNTRTEDSTRLRVWIMRGHVDSCCWSELMNIQIVPQVDPLDIVWPMFFTEKNEIMINIRKSGHNIVCDHPLKTTPIISSGDRIDRDFPIVPIQDSSRKRS